MKAAVDNAVYKCSKCATYRSVLVGATVLELRASEFAKEFSFENFKVSDGWLDRWKK